MGEVDRYVYNNFGFMFYWQGRLVFFFFLGSLSLAFGGSDGAGILCYFAGVFTLVNLCFNIWVIFRNKAYQQDVKDQAAKYHQRTKELEAQGLEYDPDALSINDIKKGADVAKMGYDNRDKVQ